MRVRPFYDNWIAKLIGVGAITLYPVVLFAMPKSQAITQRVVHHECAHVRQVRKLGWFRFYWRYLGEWFDGKESGDSVDSISFEREAYDLQKVLVLDESERAEFLG